MADVERAAASAASAPAPAMPATEAPAQPARRALPRNGLGTASLVLGILSILGAILFLPVVLGVIGLILGIIGRVRANRGEATNGGVAIAGIITSVLGILAAIALIVFVFVAGDFGSLVECLDDAGNDQAKIDQCEADFEENILGG